MKHNFFAVCLTGAAGVVFAQDPSTADQNVVVTASRAPEPLDSTLWSTTVLTRADIEARQPSSLAELLGDLAGINIVNNGGLGKVSTVLMRGAESDHTLLLVDGMRVASATAGTAPFELIPLEQIDRIEVVRGPRSTLYGSDAMGGVIQIFTRQAPHNDGVSLRGSLSGGSHDARDINLDFEARGAGSWLNLGAGSFHTNGINSCASGALAAFAACFADQPDLDGYRNNSGSVTLGHRFNDGWTAELRSLLADGHTEFDGSFGDSTDFSERVFALNVQGALGNGWTTRVLFGRDVDNQDNFSGDAPAGSFDTTRDTASVQFDGPLKSGLRLISGADYQKDKVGGDTDYSRKSRFTRAVFGELHGELAGWSTLMSGRYEDNQQFGGHWVGNVGAAHRLGEHSRLMATWGTAFHAPSFNDLYFPFGFGNPDLRPEQSRSIELGLDGAEQRLRWSLHVFQTNIEHLIAFDPVLFIPVNLDESRIRGAELQAEWRSAVWKVGSQYTQLDPINRSGGGLLLPRRAKQNASLQVHRLWPSLAVGAVVRYEGARFDDLANNRPLGGFVTLDLVAQQQIGRSLTVQARVANLLDRDYETAAFYLQDGRNYQLTLRYRFAPPPQ